ncbi:MAG: sigma-70 family RNA polymerase sigma factor [Lachnospiraceae bacterium]|nr:sigma-70 family RNA polymerase sigma factor [Lachnospiraceae bacterium]
MEDNQIIELFFRRDETALTETANKYGGFCLRIAMNVVNVREDAEECVNDTYHTAWNQIPPTKPDSFKAFLGRIVRNFAISKYRVLHAKKRFNGLEVMLSELSDCIPGTESVEQEMEAKELTEYINTWLAGLKPEDRALFVRRYWYGDEVRELAKKCGVSGTQMTQRMLRLRRKLKVFLEEKGVVL